MTYRILFDGGVVNSNNQMVYHETLPYDTPLHTTVKTITAKAVDSSGRAAEKAVKYSIIKQISDDNQVVDVFKIEEKSGVILTKKVSYQGSLLRTSNINIIIKT